MTRSSIHSFIHSFTRRAAFFRVRILKRARCIYVRALVVMCHVCICKKKRASKLFLLLRRGAPVVPAPKTKQVKNSSKTEN